MAKKEKEIKEKGKGLWTEFKEFLMQGDVMSMAVGIIIGGAFTAIVNSLVGDILNPLIALLGGDAVSNIDSLVAHMPHGVDLYYGRFIGAILNFLIIGLIMFFIVKAFNRMRKSAEKLEHKEEKPKAEETPAPTETELLGEIVTLLKNQQTESEKTSEEEK